MNYEKNFFDCACDFDEITGQEKKIVRFASSIIENEADLNKKCVKEAVHLIAKTINYVLNMTIKDEEIKTTVFKIALAFKQSLISYIGYSKIKDIYDDTKKDDTNKSELSLEKSNNDESIGFQQEEDNTECEKSLEELLTELDSLVGLTEVKQKVNDLISYHKIQKLRSLCNMKNPSSTMHMAFTGNPGTGKTTVARIVGRIYKKIGLLSKGHFIEVSRTDLIAGYQGQTALKVKKVIERAKGGVLFIDEAYSITENESSDSYGRECLTELTKALEDYRDDLVVIVAGYTKPMEQFFDSNPGLRSRFNTFIDFKDYSPDELIKILEKMSSESDYEIDEELKQILMTKLSSLLNNHASSNKEESNNDNIKKDFSNGRFIRNIYDDLIMNHAKRVIKIIDENNIDESLLSRLTLEDLEKYDW